MKNRQNRDYVKLRFALKEDTMLLKKGSGGKYDLTFKYDAQKSVLISIFTHCKDEAEMIHSITQGMKPISKGCEEHMICREGKAIAHEVKGLKIDSNDPYTFTKKQEDIKDKMYPLIIRMVKIF